MLPALPPNVTIGGLSRDYQAVVSDLLRMARQLCPEWTYQGDDDFGVVLLQLAAYLADHLHYRADATLRDSLPTRSPHREVVREYAEWLGYLARRPSPAEVDVVFGVAAALGEDLPLSRGLRCSASGPEGGVTFELTDGIVLPAGDTSLAARLVEGELQVGVLLGVATGAPGERFPIPHADCIFNWADDDLDVTVGGVTATHYRFPALLESGTLGYWVRLNPDGLLEVRFGDGTAGRSLPPGAAVYCDYRRGGGTRGNVGRGGVTAVTTPIALSDGTPVTLTVSNAEAAAGGAPEETLASVRIQAPATFRSQNRAVTGADYVTHALRVPGVFRARTAAVGVNGVRVFVVPTGVGDGQVVTAALRARITRALDLVRMETDVVTVEACNLVTVDVHLAVRALRGARNGVVRGALNDRLIGRGTGLLWETNCDLAGSLWFSDVVGELEKVVGVDNFDVLRLCRRPALRWQVSTGSAALSVTGVSINVTTRAQTWRLEMISPTEYLVTGSVSGVQGGTGTLGVAYADSLGEVSFTVETGPAEMSEGDWGEIVVGELRGNVVLGQNEFPVFDRDSLNISVTGGIGS